MMRWKDVRLGDVFRASELGGRFDGRVYLVVSCLPSKRTEEVVLRVLLDDGETAEFFGGSESRYFDDLLLARFERG